ncbi:aftiphilin-like isoform X2 [Anneissia japonica]|uniref:aftiphilin-like isoform X2 n=1 Tax=Anneissia japonica TaxID=1529436 RepID=UPI0014256346|nr:aftiphilin-like isoform X2 [Anneissia japonica]
MSSTDGPFIPMVSSSPPPMDDGGFDEDDDDFGSFSQYGSDLVGSPPGLKHYKATKNEINFKPVKEDFEITNNQNGSDFRSFTKDRSNVDDDFGDFADASNGNSFPSENTLQPLTNGNSTHSEDWQSNGNQEQSIDSSTDVKKQTLDLFSEFHSSNANDSKDTLSKDSTSISSMDDDFSDFSAFTSGANPGHIPDEEKDTSNRNDKQSSTAECHNSYQTKDNIDGDTNLKVNSDTKSAMTLERDITDPNSNAFQKQNTLSKHEEITNDDDFGDMDSKRNDEISLQESSNIGGFAEFGNFQGKSIDIKSDLKTSEDSGKKNYESSADNQAKVDTAKLDFQDDFASFSSFSKPNKKGFSNDFVSENKEIVEENAFTGNNDNNFGAHELKPSSDDLGNFESKPVSSGNCESNTTELDDFGNFESKTTTRSNDFGNFESKPVITSENCESKTTELDDFGNFESKTISSDDFGNYESKSTSSDDFGKFTDFSNQKKSSEAKKEADTSFQQMKSDKFADFGNFESKNVEDDFGEFGTFQESTTSQSGAQNDDDDFGSFSSNNTTSDDFCKFSTAPSKPSATIPKVTGSKLDQVFRVCFPSNCDSIETENTINTLLDVIKEETKESERKKNTNGSTAINIWDKLQNMEKTNALAYQWADSSNNKQLLTALAIDTRNILSSKKRPTPIFASDLGLLIPSKAGEKVEKQQEPSPEETLISTSISAVIPDEESSTKIEFDWSGSGLTNPLDGGLDSEFLGLEMSSPLAPPPGGSSTKPLDSILKNMQTSMVTQPKKDENLSQEANNVLSNLPQLSFMHAKVLMFPMNPVPKNSTL